MKRARIIVLGIAFVAAGSAAMLARGVLNKPPSVQKAAVTMDVVDVLVAGDRINLGDPVKSASLSWQSWPSEAVAPSFILRTRNPKAIDDYVGAIARAPFTKGEPINEHKLIKTEQGGVLSAILPRGMRAISVRISPETGAGGFILPNDYVDVILTRRNRGGGGEDHFSQTLLRNVRILAIDQTIQEKDGEKVVVGKTATMELKPRQAEILALAQAIGEISLTLRSLADVNPSRNGAPEADDDFGSERGSVLILKYGFPSKVLGVN